MSKSLFRALAAMALAGFAPTVAHAVVPLTSYNFDFATASKVAETSGVGNYMIFKSLTDPKLQVKVTAWSIDRDPVISTASLNNAADDIVTKATLKLWDGGLGVQNKYESDTSPNHSIDNGVDSSGSKYMVDFVMLQFNWNVDVNTMTTGWVSGDSDASVRVGTPLSNNPFNWTSTPLLDNKNVVATANKVDLSDYVNTAPAANTGMDPLGGNSPGLRNVNTTNQKGMTWLIGALYGTQTDDYFKLDMLNVTVFPTIPEPSTWLTMILGFGFIGGTMRRRNAPAKKASGSLA